MDNTGELFALIERGKQLLDENSFNTGKKRVWEQVGERTLEQLYDKEIARTFGLRVSGSAVIRGGMSDSDFYHEIYRPEIERGIEYLESLQSVEMPKLADKPAQGPAASQHFPVNNQHLVPSIEFGRLHNSSISNFVMVNSNGLRIGDITNSDVSNINVLNGVSNHDFKALVETLERLNDPEANTYLEQLPKKLNKVSFWKKLIDKVGAPAGKVALQIFTGAALETIKQYLHTKGIVF